MSKPKANPMAGEQGSADSERCDLGLTFWDNYTGTDDLQTEGSNHGQA